MRQQEDVRICVNNLIAKIHAEATSYKEQWRSLPYWAVNADGRIGYSEQLSRAYLQGYWSLEASIKDGGYTVCVDLETGKLVDARYPQKVAKDEDVLPLAFHIDQLNAENIVIQLKSRSLEPVAEFIDKAERNRWLRGIALLELNPDCYKRNSHKTLLCMATS